MNPHFEPGVTNHSYQCLIYQFRRNGADHIARGSRRREGGAPRGYSEVETGDAKDFFLYISLRLAP